MVLMRNRIPIIATGLILLLAFSLLFIAERAKADDVEGVPFDANLTDNNRVTWNWTNVGNAVKIDIFLADASTITGKVFAIEVFIDPSTDTALGDRAAKADHIERLSNNSAFPIGKNLTFSFQAQQIISGSTVLGLHLHESNGTRILATDQVGTLPTPPTPTPAPPAPTATPVSITEIPDSQVTPVPVPSGGASVIIQPSKSATVSAPDGSVVVTIPNTSNDTTFQLVYDPSPSNVPAGDADTTILRPFALNTHDANSVAKSMVLIKAVTVTAKYTANDVAGAPQNSPINLKIMRYNETNSAWTALNTTVDLAAQTLTARVKTFSLFAVAGVDPPAQAIATATPVGLPPTGDVSPGSGLLLGLLLAGFLMIVAGGTYLVQSRRNKPQ